MAVIALIPAETARRGFPGLRNPVTVEHTPWTCDRCGCDCWIGPEQKKLAQIKALTGVEALCYHCIVRENGDNVEIIGLNPRIEQVQRRFG